MRILHLPVASGRQAWGLSRAEIRAGFDSRVVVFENTPYKLNCDQILFSADDGPARRELKRWKLFLTSLFRYDVFHFHFGQKFFTLFPRASKAGDSPRERVLRIAYWVYSLLVGRLDVLVLRMLGKKIFMTYHGDDIRQGDRSLELYEFSIAQEVGPDYYDAYTDARKRRMGAYYQRVCRQVYVVSPDLLAMAPQGAKLLHYTGVHPNEWPATLSPKKPRLMIAHAPTHRLAKGTRFIEAAVASLKKRGFEFDFVTIEKMANDEARRIYEKADVVIDQLLAGWYGVFAIELMAMGKPVIVYARDEDLALEPSEFQNDFPLIRANPKTIEAVLEEVIRNPAGLRDAGIRSRAFVEHWYQPDKIAADVIRDYQN
jgi:hypothetical protein